MSEVTQDDVDAANEERLLLLARVGLITGWAVTAAAIFGVLSWLWLEVRLEQHGEGFRFGGDQSVSISVLHRIDLFTTYLAPLLEAAIAGAVGVGLLLASSHLYARTGRPLARAA